MIRKGKKQPKLRRMQNYRVISGLLRFDKDKEITKGKFNRRSQFKKGSQAEAYEISEDCFNLFVDGELARREITWIEVQSTLEPEGLQTEIRDIILEKVKRETKPWKTLDRER